ncbi:hypothetical protein V6N12_051367 [Hibiscus sabdariffa]|uniref:Uncharacterized protein n=1 Tax=Hibiscus sabdariffa TaxID=183260 RepID=A0ABR2GF41_9ROSI
MDCDSLPPATTTWTVSFKDAVTGGPTIIDDYVLFDDDDFDLLDEDINCGIKDDYIDALTDGPWTIFGHYITVEPWSPRFRPFTGIPKANIGLDSACRTANYMCPHSLQSEVSATTNISPLVPPLPHLPTEPYGPLIFNPLFSNSDHANIPENTIVVDSIEAPAKHTGPTGEETALVTEPVVHYLISPQIFENRLVNAPSANNPKAKSNFVGAGGNMMHTDSSASEFANMHFGRLAMME